MQAGGGVDENKIIFYRVNLSRRQDAVTGQLRVESGFRHPATRYPVKALFRRLTNNIHPRVTGEQPLQIRARIISQQFRDAIASRDRVQQADSQPERG